MNKLSGKFIAGITMILLITTGISLYLNSALIHRYYLYEKKTMLNKVCDQMLVAISKGADQYKTIRELEETEEVTIAWLSNTSDLDSLNETLRTMMREKGIGFQKFWLWEQGYQILMQEGRKISLYNQGKLNYSLLVEYMEIGTDVYAVAMMIPHLSDAIRIVNVVTTAVMIVALLVAIGLIMILVRRITKPLNDMKQLADDIAVHKFHSIEIHTHDELETVAGSMNQMCADIQAYQNELLDKNRQISELLDHVTHDLKTPVALIKAYATGIKDGLDDGTFLDTIIRQNDRMSGLIERLLYLSRMEKREPAIGTVDLVKVLEQILEEQAMLLEKETMFFHVSLPSDAYIESNEELVTLMISNLISNALKYSSGNIIEVTLEAVTSGYLLEIKNDTKTRPDTDRLWEPFYVGETSRNKDLSGTGLGLALVKESAGKIGASVFCHMEGNTITFGVLFPEKRLFGI